MNVIELKSAKKPTKTPPKCPDCIYYKRDYVGKRFGRCQRKDYAGLGGGNFCSCERMSYEYIDTCGMEGKYFVRRPPTLWQRFLMWIVR